MRGGHETSSGAVGEVLTLVCSSGFVGVQALSLVSVLYCNALRESVSYLLRIDGRTPERLMGVLRPQPAPAPVEEGRPGRILLPLNIRHLRLGIPRDVSSLVGLFSMIDRGTSRNSSPAVQGNNGMTRCLSVCVYAIVHNEHEPLVYA